MDWCVIFVHIQKYYFSGIREIIWLSHCPWSDDEMTWSNSVGTQPQSFTTETINHVHDFRLHCAVLIPTLIKTWCLKNMMTSSNGNIFRVTGHLCEEFTCPRWIPRTKASDAELWCFFDLRLNKRLSKQSWGWWFETQSRLLWRHCNA